MLREDASKQKAVVLLVVPAQQQLYSLISRLWEDKATKYICLSNSASSLSNRVVKKNGMQSVLDSQNSNGRLRRLINLATATNTVI